MPSHQSLIKKLFVNIRWYLLMSVCAVFFLLSYFFTPLFFPATVFFSFIILLSFLDIVLLFGIKGKIVAERIVSQKLSLGDPNSVILKLNNQYPYSIWVNVIDELPYQFQNRKFSIGTKIKFGKRYQTEYQLRPKTRGIYEFGRLLLFVQSPIRLFEKRVIVSDATSIKVYPSFQQLKKYQLMALSESYITGDKKIRRSGNSMEFEKIKDYVLGDDIRNINWKATARRNTMMLNTYTDARQQQIYCVIDKGRAMKMPFDGLSLLDYAINASLALLNIALIKQDKAGLITIAKDQVEIIPADRRNNQFFHIQEALYNQTTSFKESDFNTLRSVIQKKVGQRSLLLLFTNFETMAALERQLPYLKLLSKQHLLCVIFFENTALKQLQNAEAKSIKEIYVKTIADRFDFEKKQIVKELRRHGILSILSTPKSLSVDVINKYLELKSRQMV